MLAFRPERPLFTPCSDACTQEGGREKRLFETGWAMRYVWHAITTCLLRSESTHHPSSPFGGTSVCTCNTSYERAVVLLFLLHVHPHLARVSSSYPLFPNLPQPFLRLFQSPHHGLSDPEVFQLSQRSWIKSSPDTSHPTYIFTPGVAIPR